MAVNYNINPLGGFNLGQGISQVFGAYQQGQEKEKLEAQREQLQQAALGAAKGDPQAIEQLFALDPNMAMMFEKRQAQMSSQEAAAKDQAFTEWGLKYAAAKTPEEKQALEQEALSNPMIDFDESDMALTQGQKDLVVNAALYKNLGKDMYQQFIAGEKPEKGTFQLKETPYGFIQQNTATGETKEIPLDSVRAKSELEKQKSELEKQIKSEEKTFKRAEKLRGEYSDKTKEFQKVDDAFARVKASTESPDAAGDIALIFNYMKMLDPGSVVREGEFATAQNAGGVTTSVINMYNKLLSGERLSDSQRNMFKSRAEKLYSAAKSKADKQRKDILGLAKRYDLTEQDIFGIQEQNEVENVVNWSDL